MRRYVLAMTVAFVLVAPFAMSTWGDSQAQEKSTKEKEKEAKAKAKETTAPTQSKPAPTEEKPAPAQGQATGDVEAGRELYGVHCKKCHADQGQGVPRMYRLVKATIVHLGSKEAQAKTDAEIRKSMTHGFGKMEAVPDLSAAQVESVLAFTRTLKQ